ncbi:hypothetical protein CEQ15_08465 [Chryseobacterium indologenes]|nr:hypothetical protein CEQ15_08465 [Chryseobacterium indologenes]
MYGKLVLIPTNWAYIINEQYFILKKIWDARYNKVVNTMRYQLNGIGISYSFTYMISCIELLRFVSGNYRLCCSLFKSVDFNMESVFLFQG